MISTRLPGRFATTNSKPAADLLSAD